MLPVIALRRFQMQKRALRQAFLANPDAGLFV